MSVIRFPKQGSASWRETITCGSDWAKEGAIWIEAASDQFGASLACTDVGDMLPEHVQLPGRSLRFGIRGVDGVTCAWLRLKRHNWDDMLKGLAPDIKATSKISRSDFPPERHSMSATLAVDFGPYVVQVYADTVWEMLTRALVPLQSENKASFLLPSERDIRTVDAVRRQVIGLLWSMPNKSNWTYQGMQLARAKRLRGVPGTATLVVLGGPVRCDVTEGLRRHLGGEGASPTVRFMVRGHYRNQAHGPARSQRKLIWIQPHWKGDEGAPILVRPHVLGSSH